MSAVSKRKNETEEVSESKFLKTEVTDSAIFEYDNLLNNYKESEVRHIEDYKNYCDSYEIDYSTYYIRERDKQLKKSDEAMALELKKIEEKKGSDSTVEVLKKLSEKISFKEENLSKNIQKAEQYAHKKTKKYMKEKLPQPQEKRQDGEKYFTFSVYENTYMEVVSMTTQKKPSGWKIHLSINPTLVNLKKAWNIFKDILLKNSVGYAKVANHERTTRIEPGKEITIYQNPEEKCSWQTVVLAIEVGFKQNSIIPSSHFAEGDKPIQGSRYASYRNDFCPDSHHTLRLEKITPLIGKIADAIEQKKKDKHIIKLTERGLKELVKAESVRKEWGLKLFNHVKREKQKKQDVDLSTLWYNPFDIEGDPNALINVQSVYTA